MDNDLSQKDVTVIGGGMAGMAACIHLARAGLEVLVIEADSPGDEAVGESLDWSAPDLLKTLGLPMELLLEQGVATYKRHVILKLRDGSERHYIPGEWLGRPPFNINLDTLHVDRTQLNRMLRGIVLDHGVKLHRGRVAQVDSAGRRVTAVVTVEGERIASPWFIDATGSTTSLFPRHFNLQVTEYGPRKVAIWDYFTVPESIDGTTLHAEVTERPYMEWVWQIPIHPHMISVGYVSPGDAVKEKRQRGQSVPDIFKAKLERFADLRGLVDRGPESAPLTTSFRCRVFNGITGPNWLVVGESAAMIDPMTSNGVTAALRNAAEASGLITRYHNRTSIPRLPAAMYNRRVVSLAKFFNKSIERVMYDWPIRNRIGPFNAGDVYTVPAWSINVVYSRLRPRGLVKTTLFRLLLASLVGAMNVLYWFCKRSRSSAPVCEAS